MKKVNVEEIDVEDLEHLTDDELEDIYEEQLNDNYEPVEICGHEYLQGKTLKEVDYDAFREGFNNWLSDQITDGNILEIKGEFYRA